MRIGLLGGKMKKGLIILGGIFALGFSIWFYAKDENLPVVKDLTVCYENAPDDSYLQAAMPMANDKNSWYSFRDYALDMDGCATISNLPKDSSYVFVDTTRGSVEGNKWYGPSRKPSKIFVNGIRRSIPSFSEWTPNGGGYKIKL
ncbi:hypothetical protein JW977_03095 [Candidatus Falkowbacteria bacterium]|nr:hypothetical protein [Candidatus Falkowbacteria bacterium]